MCAVALDPLPTNLHLLSLGKTSFFPLSMGNRLHLATLSSPAPSTVLWHPETAVTGKQLCVNFPLRKGRTLQSMGPNRKSSLRASVCPTVCDTAVSLDPRIRRGGGDIMSEVPSGGGHLMLWPLVRAVLALGSYRLASCWMVQRETQPAQQEFMLWACLLLCSF